MMEFDENVFRHIGRPIPRKEDERLLRGLGRFTDDFNLPGQYYAAFVRSPCPHARIGRIDVESARKCSGVAGVFVGADCARDGLGPIQHNPVPSTKHDLKLTGPGGAEVFIGPHVLLPTDKARHVGEAVAMVVAETHAQAMDAAELVEVDFEELPHVTESWKAAEPGAPVIWEQVPDNVLVETIFGDAAATDAAFSAADHVVKARYHVGRVTAVPIEPRAALADYDPETGRYVLYAGSGGAVRQKGELARLLGIEADRLRVIS
ncbi:MAG: molybdopterin-dependent oxidoreductase, partial [Alphaproteobacteria bacterium]|nr:molybdopterin-dependent oxidoreductase [Alphaproteobacteria bacterium]